jgi:hypothetical protein
VCTRDYINNPTGKKCSGTLNKEQVGWKVRNHASLGMVCSPIFFILSNIFFLSSFPTKKLQNSELKNVSRKIFGKGRGVGKL